ncbi:MAG: tyrosine-type recombinase/integrase [Alphaproteobacteria bacterium]|nr:tyrosine-type recombinase/integrase [Alphaproteobacteria bacterium]
MKLFFQHENFHQPWNKGKLIGQKPPLKLKEIWAIRIRLQMKAAVRDLALFNLAIDSKLRACDLVKLKVSDVCDGSEVKHRALVLQQKTGNPVRFEVSKQARESILKWITKSGLGNSGYLFPSRGDRNRHLSTRQYARALKSWIRDIGLDPSSYGTHSLRQTKASLIYKQTKNLRAVQLLLGHSKMESTVRYLGIDVDDALEVAEQLEI